jgi:hypothetical protein
MTSPSQEISRTPPTSYLLAGSATGAAVGAGFAMVLAPCAWGLTLVACKCLGGTDKESSRYARRAFLGTATVLTGGGALTGLFATWVLSPKNRSPKPE